MKMTIGENIKRLRTAKELTQEQLSVAMNVTCAAVSKWERGVSHSQGCSIKYDNNTLIYCLKPEDADEEII